MQRRSALKQLLILAGGTLLLPSCIQQDKKASIPLQYIKISGEQELLLAEVCETLLPETDTPGAKELGVHQFVLTMIDDCYNKETQTSFLNGLNELDRLSEKYFHNTFVQAKPAERETLLNKLEEKEFSGDLASFYSLMKELTIQGYTKSNYVMSNLLKYELVPGRFLGCVPVNDKIRLKQNG